MQPRRVGRTAEDAFAVSPLVDVLVRLLDERWGGTLLLHDDGDQPFGALRIDFGAVVAGRVRGGAGTLFEQLSALCAREDVRIVEVAGADLVGDGPQVAPGRVDPLPLIAAAMRGPIGQALVDRALASVGADPLKLNPQADIDRYGLDRCELQTLAALELEPLDLGELRARSSLSEPQLRRLLCALLATRALTVIPAWKRCASGEIVHAPPLPSPGNTWRGDEPTAVVSLEALARAHAARAASHPARRATRTHLEYLPKPMNRAPVARPPSSDERPSVPYLMHHPRSGVEVACSSAPPPPGQRPSEKPARNEADAHFRWAERLLESGNFRGAVFEAQRAMKLARPRPEQRALYAWALYRRAYGGAHVQEYVWEHLELALDEDPNCATAYYFKGALLARAGHSEEAIAHLERALELDPEHAQAASELRNVRSGAPTPER